MITEFQGEYRFLSNFWPCHLTYEDFDYRSVEHAYQAAKTLDPEWRKMIRETLNAGYAKTMGAKAPRRESWDDIKLEIMRDLVWRKFFDWDLRKMLLATGDQELIEGNTWGDTFWGVCNGVGENNLGLILMNIRERIRVRQQMTPASNFKT